MTPLFMIDTDIASYILKDVSDLAQRRLAQIPQDRLCISVVTRAELRYGLQALAATHRLHEAVRRFLGLIAHMPWDEAAADCYAEIKHGLVRRGTVIGELDMLIAAHAIAADAVLVTNNLRHFERIGAPLRLESWARA